ncbi:unnamed protein product, partial [Ectocarpus sp. 8 AP-2014]
MRTDHVDITAVAGPPRQLNPTEPTKKLGDVVRQHPSLVLQAPEPPQHLGQGRVSNCSSIATVFSPLAHERQHAVGLAAVGGPVLGARAPRYGLCPCRHHPRGAPSITAGGVVTTAVIAASLLGSTIERRSMPAGQCRRGLGRRAEHGGETFAGYQESRCLR